MIYQCIYMESRKMEQTNKSAGQWKTQGGRVNKYSGLAILVTEAIRNRVHSWGEGGQERKRSSLVSFHNWGREELRKSWEQSSDAGCGHLWKVTKLSLEEGGSAKSAKENSLENDGWFRWSECKPARDEVKKRSEHGTNNKNFLSISIHR